MIAPTEAPPARSPGDTGRGRRRRSRRNIGHNDMNHHHQLSRTARGRSARVLLTTSGYLSQWAAPAEVIARLDARRRLRHSMSVLGSNPHPLDLVASERRVYSQNGEDGIVEEIFRRVGTTNRQFVEIGASDGSENCTRLLAEQGWGGVWIEADPVRASRARDQAPPGTHVITAGAQPGNVIALLARAGAPRNPDLLVLDIDGNDWWVLDSLLDHYLPRVLVVEYNSSYVPGQRWSEPYDPNRGWDGTFRHGASLEALASRAGAAGLSLVACDSAGVNAFFVARDCLGDRFLAPSSTQEHYRPPGFSASPWGHVRPRSVMRPMLPLAEEDLRQVQLTDAHRVGSCGPVPPGGPTLVQFSIRNGASTPLVSGDPAPMTIALTWSGGAEPAPGDVRANLPFVINPGRSRKVIACAQAPLTPGHWTLGITLVQEHVAWLCDITPQAKLDVPVEVLSPPAVGR